MATSHFITVADAVVVRVVVNDRARAVRGARARLANAVYKHASRTVVRGGSLVVARRVVLATSHFITVANAVVIRVVINDRAGAVRGSRANIAVTRGIDT